MPEPAHVSAGTISLLATAYPTGKCIEHFLGKGVGKPPGRFPTGKNVAKRIIIPAGTYFAGFSSVAF